MDLWIDAHPEGGGTPMALNGPSWARALEGRDLDKALADINRGLRLSPKNAAFFDTRGLVHLQPREFDDAIKDYDNALALNPKQSWSLYGRGLAKRLKGDAPGGAVDLAAAAELNPRIVEEARAHGIDGWSSAPGS